MSKEILYWFVVFLTFVFFISKSYKSPVKTIIILCFFSGLASFSGKTIENPYKIILVIYSIYILFRFNGLSALSKKEIFVYQSFILFAVTFIISALINNSTFNLTYSQLGKYVTPFCLLFIFSKIQKKNPAFIFELRQLLFSLLTAQIVLSVVKILTIGLQETTVGSIANIGGGPAAIIPILGFIFLWLYKLGKIKRNDWLYIFLLVFIGFTSGKRAVWFILPIFIFLFLYYVPKNINIKRMLIFVPLLPLIFYLGVKLNPTLNKEGKVWGSFDLEYVINYVNDYNFGKNSETKEIELGKGRGGATLLLFDKLSNSTPLSFNDYWGYGLEEMYTTDYDTFDKDKFGVNSKGSITGIFQSYIVSGYIGVITSILLLFSVTMMIKHPRIRFTIGLLLFWDYIFYSGLILRTQALLTLLFFIIVYSNFLIESVHSQKDINKKAKKNPWFYTHLNNQHF
jgi:hypothetical protein